MSQAGPKVGLPLTRNSETGEGKSMFQFVKNAFLRGLVILIPIVVLFITLRELYEIMVGLATPIADLFPEGLFGDRDTSQIIAVLLIVVTALVLGVLWSLRATRPALHWLEDHSLNRISMYRMLKSLVAAFLNINDAKSFKPACLRHADGSLEPIYVIEAHGSDMLVVMLPWTPTPFAGSVKVVPADQVEELQVTLDEYSMALTHFGLGMSQAIGNREQHNGP